MRDVVLGIAVGLAWLALWAISLRAFGIPALERSPEKRATRKERALAMGKLRYVLIFGMLGYGLSLGLSIVVASGTLHSSAWRATTQLLIWTIGFGSMQGVATWNESFHGKVPFPPHYPPPK